MKKVIIGSLVGALLIFLWQFLSFALVNLHRPAQDYTEKQTEILNFLSTSGLEEGGYIVPSLPADATQEQHQDFMEAQDGKPWASIQYHKAMDTGMTMNMIRGYVVNIVIVFLFCWIITRLAAPTFGRIFGAALAVGMIGFFNNPYTGHIWYDTFDIWAYLLDAVVSWGLVGLWLGWYLGRRNA